MTWRGVPHIAIANFDSLCLCHQLDDGRGVSGDGDGARYGADDGADAGDVAGDGAHVLELTGLLSSWGWRHIIHVYVGGGGGGWTANHGPLVTSCCHGPAP